MNPSNRNKHKQWIYMFSLLLIILVNEASCRSRGDPTYDDHGHRSRFLPRNRRMGKMGKKEPTLHPTTQVPSEAPTVPPATARPTIRPTFPPRTKGPAAQPTFPPTTAEPSEPFSYPKCDICGPGLVVTYPKYIVDPPGIECGYLDIRGQSGLISPDYCDYYQQPWVRNGCGCKNPSSTSEPTALPSAKPTFNGNTRQIELSNLALISSTPIMDVFELKRSTTAYLNVYFAARDDEFLGLSLSTPIDDKLLVMINSNTDRRKLEDIPFYLVLGAVAVYKSDADRTTDQVNMILVDALLDLDTFQPFLNYAMGDEAPELTTVLFENPPSTSPPNIDPTDVPTNEPTGSPTTEPTDAPTIEASDEPTIEYTIEPTDSVDENLVSVDENWVHCGGVEWCYLPRQECNLNYMYGVGLSGYCTCKPGYHNDNSDYCNGDLNECTDVDPPPCHTWEGGYCVNTFPHQGGYTCHCNEGYIAIDDLGHGPTKCLTPGSCLLNSFLCDENEMCVRSDSNGQYYCN